MSFESFIVGNDSEGAKKQVEELNEEIIKVQNSIDKTKLSDISIDEKAVKKSTETLEKLFKDIDAQIEIFNIEDLSKQAADVEKIFIETGAAAKSALSKVDDPFGGEEAFFQILKLEDALKSLKKQVDEGTFDVLKGFSVEQLDLFSQKLRELNESSRLFAEGTASAINSVGGAIANSIKSNSEIVNSFIGSILKSLSSFLAEIATNAIKNIAIKKAEATANAVAAGSATAAASGPGAAFLLPALIAGAVAIIGGAFGSIKFAQGGIVPGGNFSGDRIPALLNSGEMVLNRGQQSKLFDIANGNIRKNSSSQGKIEVQGVLRGSNILLSSKRQERKNKRFN